MKITLVGMGGGTFDSVTMQGAEALHEATLIIGAKRLLENLPDFCTQNQCLKQQKNKISHLYTAVTPDFIPAPLHCAACSMNATSDTP